MNRFDRRRRELFKSGVGVGPQPRGGERAALCLSGFGEEFFFVFSLPALSASPKKATCSIGRLPCAPLITVPSGMMRL